MIEKTNEADSFEETVKKAMISQPMAGKTDEEIAATRDLAVAKLCQMGYEVVNTLFTDEWYSRQGYGGARCGAGSSCAILAKSA